MAGSDLRSQAMARVAEQARAEARQQRPASSSTRAPRSSSSSSSTRAPRSSSSSTRAPRPASSAAAAPAAAPAAADDETDETPEPAPAAPGPARSFGTEGAGAFLALFAYPLLVNLLQGGPGQMFGWIKAKWLNKPYGAVSSPGPTATTGQQTVFLPAATTQPNGQVTRTGLKAT